METVKLNKAANGIWTCTLSRPEKLNALSSVMIAELTKCFAEVTAAAERFECRVLLLSSSSPKAFCVGADLGERRTMSEAQVLETLNALRAMTCALESIPVPTVAVIEGAAFGGGLELALCCDLRVASAQATMGLTETRLAIIPGAGGTQRLAKIIGIASAKELIYTGRRLLAEDAARFGVVNACVDDARAWAEQVAQEIVEAGPVAILAAKCAIDAGAGLPIQEALDVERGAYERTLKTSDRLEGLKAFDEKRKPKYQGR